MDATRDPVLLPPPEGFPGPAVSPRRPRKRSRIAIAVGVLAVLLAVAVGLVVFMLRFEARQVALVEDALATLASGEPLPADMVCADPDEVVSDLVVDPRSWPVASYEVLGVSGLSYDTGTPVSQWFVDAVVNEERWLVEVWDTDAGRMAGICGIAALPGR